MITSLQAFNKFGFDQKKFEKEWMVLWDVPTELEIRELPNRVYCNKLMVSPLTESFKQLLVTGCVNELKTWDGCYNPRPIRGYENKFKVAFEAKQWPIAAKYASMHYWGIAVDVNAAWNGLGKIPQLSLQFVKCFTDNGFDWGGNFTRLDGMHFQLSKF
jgi:hypothetical protein